MKKLICTFILTVMACLLQAQTVEQVYHYSQPTLSECDGYQQVSLQGCLPSGAVGEPTLPWQSVSLILPMGQEALSVHVELSDWTELEGQHLLYPVQKPRPISNEEAIPFAKDEALYRSTTPYPSKGFEAVNTQYLNGVAFAFSGFTPVRYVPATGKVSYAKTARVVVETTQSRDDHSGKLWLTPENEASIKRLAQNEAPLGTYHGRGREVSGYDMLVITAEEWMPKFDEYLNLYNGKGIRTRIVALEEIYASMTGRDEQEQIRNYIIQEYENNGISMVSLGGDVSIVPFRHLWCFAQEGSEDQLPSDMYYACLDGTLNDNGNDRWGEVGEDDLLPELGIGRLPFNNEAQFDIIMGKTFSYLLNPVLGEFTSPILGAEHLGDGYYGSDDMERLIGTSTDFDYTTQGYPTHYNFKKYYASPSVNFSGGGFRNLIGTGGQYVHHVGHANTDVVAGWEGNMMGDNYFAGNDGVNHNYMLFHSHGCICGDFSHACVLEKMVTIPTGFVLTTGNSRYGWYVPWGDGMAAHIHREFLDAYCHDHIPTVGMALREAKIATAPWVTLWGEEGCLRWNIYCLNLLGDAGLYPWFEEPFHPNVHFEDGLTAGTTSTTLQVTHFDEPLSNFSVRLFDGETLLASGLTDNDGEVTLTFEPGLEVTGTLQLIVTGQSAWPQILEVNAISGDEAYVYGNIEGLDGEPEYFTSLWVSGDLYNKGAVTAHNVHADISTDCPYVTILDNNFTIDAFEPNSTQHFDHLGAIQIADNIPDQTIFTLDLTTSLEEVTHTTQKTFLAKAPNLQFTDFVVDDSEGDHNGYVDPGERITLHVNGKNIGHCESPEAYLSVSCEDERIHLETSTVSIGTVGIDGSFTADLVFTSDNDIVSGTLFTLNLELQAGAYTTTTQHSFTNGLIKETFESADFSFIEWEHAGELPWVVTDEEAHSGTYSARTGAIGDNEFSRMLVYVDVLTDGEISFWFKTSTEYHKDYFAFYIDDRKKDWWSGENDWTYASYAFTAGSHVFEWLYGKGPSGISGEDCAWVDDIILPRSSIVTKVEAVTAPSAVLLYPNPSHGQFTLELSEESTVEIYNLLGQKVMSLEEVNGRQALQLDENGMYLVRILNATGAETLKLVVE